MKYEHDEFKLSSTRLQTYFNCPARWWYTYIRGDGGIEPNEAMAVGTVFHAIQEYRLEAGWFPSQHDVRAMEGNYDPPRKAMDRFPDAWDIAEHMAREAGVPDEIPDGVEVEVGLEEDLELKIGGIPVTGFFDLLARADRHILDWKTRSRMDYAPRTLEDFMSRAQPLYYPAAARQAFGWESVKFTHLNVLRPGGSLRPVTVELDGHILDTFWEHLEDEVVPHMKQMNEPAEADKDTSACWMYGQKCPFYDECQDSTEGSFFDIAEDEEVKIVSDEAPDNIEPVPYEEKTVDKLGFDARQVRNLQDAGIYTLGDLDAYDGDLTDISYIGEKTLENVQPVWDSFRETQ